MEVTKRRRTIIAVGTLLFVLYGAFPPWMQFDHRGFNGTFFWDANWAAYNLARLFIGWFMIFVVTCVAVLLIHDKRSGT